MQSLKVNRACAMRTAPMRASRARARGLQVSALFTGIVQGMATVSRVDRKQDFSHICISFPPDAMADVKIGASVAINGTCLTVVHAAENTVEFDVIKETLRATNLGKLDEGSYVNYERSARVGDEIGGHNVSGHVHCVAAIKSIEDTENNRKITYELPDSSWMKYILPKGFIAVDGTSLTVGEVVENTFCVYLIPETLRVTVHGTKQVSDTVNIEIDAQTQAIVDTVERVVARYIKQ